MEREITYPEGSLVFDEKNGGLSLVRVIGNFTEVNVPEKHSSEEGLSKRSYFR